MSGEDSDIDDKHITALLRDELFKLALQKQVSTLTDERLAFWRTIGLIVAVPVLAVLSFVGFRVTTWVQQANALVQQVKASADDAQKALADLQKQRLDALETWLKLNQEMEHTLGEANSKLSAVQSTNTASQRYLEQSRSLIAEELSSINNQIAFVRSDAEKLDRTRTDLENSRRVLEDLQAASRKVDNQEKELNERIEAQKETMELNSKMFARSQVEYILLRSRNKSSSTVHLDYMQLQNKQLTSLNTYVVTFSSPRITNGHGFDLLLRVKDGNGKEQAYRCTNLSQQDGPVLIPGTNFAMRPEFVYHRRLTVNFLALKIFPSEGNASVQKCSSTPVNLIQVAQH